MIIKCPECNKPVSSTLDACPHCGYRISDEEKNVLIEKAKDNEITSTEKEDESLFQLGGFFLGLIFGILGVLLAFVTGKKSTFQSAAAGFVVELVIAAIIVPMIILIK